jgi:hypothetical protein
MPGAESRDLIAWAPDERDQCRVAARYADQILREKKAGDIPVAYPEPLARRRRERGSRGPTTRLSMFARVA